MDITLMPVTLEGTIKGIASKSFSHRALIGAALAEGSSTLDNLLGAADIDASRRALKQLGATIDNQQIEGPLGPESGVTINAGESGSTLRFLIPIAALFNVAVRFEGEGKLPERPLDIYENIFTPEIHYERHGPNHLPLTIKGPLQGGRYVVPGHVSSQFISGLLFALPLAKKDSVIEVQEPFESKSYVNLTLSTLKRFGIDIDRSVPRQYRIKGNQQYKPAKLDVEADYSQAAFWLVAGMMGETITVEGLNPESLQGDRKVLEILTSMNGHIELFGHSVRAHPSKTMGKTIDLSQIPDLGPVLMVLAAVSTGKSRFINAGRLRLKESDRLYAMQTTLETLGVPVKTHETSMEITGVKSLKGNVTIDSFNDHRVAMAAAIASIKADGPITITNFECTEKSYPTFLKDLISLGANIKEREK